MIYVILCIETVIPLQHVKNQEQQLLHGAICTI